MGSASPRMKLDIHIGTKVTNSKQRSSKSVVFKLLIPAVTQQSKRPMFCFVVFGETAPQWAMAF
jgi:hypothetical protein